MNAGTIGALVAFGMFGGTLALIETGRRFGAARMLRDPEGAKADASAVEGAVVGLMGLLIAFTFSGAAARFEARRAQIVDEANAIGTAWLRLDLLPGAAQPAMREKFRHYTDARLAVFSHLPDIDAARAEMDRATLLQSEIWVQAVAACHEPGTPSSTTVLLLPALNQMFDIATVRTQTVRFHPPLVIYGMLTLLVLASALLAGYHMNVGKGRSWLHSLSFAVILSLAIYIILDFEFPRVGLIRLHGFDQVFNELRQSMR